MDVLELNKLKEIVGSLFKESSDIKFDIRTSSENDVERIDASLVSFSKKIDDVISFICEDLGCHEVYYDYRGFFKKFYDTENAYKSYNLLKFEEYESAYTELAGTKKYFNYCIEHLIIINNFSMKVEFDKIREKFLEELHLF